MASRSSAPTPRLFVLRHGERADAVKDSGWKDPDFPYDPPLTPAGHEHAKTAGGILRSKFPSLSGVRVICSPFLRCLQTATHIANSLEQSSIDILPQFSDILSEYGHIFSDVRWRWAEKQIDPIIHQVDTARFSQVPDVAYPAFRETNESAAARYRAAFSNLRTRYPTEHLVLVSHWYTLEVGAGMKDNSVTNFKAGYCAMLEIDTSDWNVVSFQHSLDIDKSN